MFGAIMINELLLICKLSLNKKCNNNMKNHDTRIEDTPIRFYGIYKITNDVQKYKSSIASEKFQKII